MYRILDCLVSYFGLDERERPGYERYFCYHVVAGPGPSDGAGVAVVKLLAAHDPAERCDYCRHFHTTEHGGPEAAIAAAVHYLDAYHEADHVRKVQTALRPRRGKSAFAHEG
jgi:hypothetical protein